MAPTTLEPEPRTASLRSRATINDLLAMPEDGKRYWLIDGEIVEMGMTQRNKHHSQAESNLNYLLKDWLVKQPKPRGSVRGGEVGVILDLEAELSVGIDVIYLSPEQTSRNANDDLSTMIVGAPTLAVEILSPSNTMAIIHKKIDTYLAHGVAVVWLVDTHFRTVTIHRPQRPSVMLNSTEELDGSPELPGFRIAVEQLFDD